MSGFRDFIKKHKIRLIVLGSIFVFFWILFGIRYIPAVSEFWSKTIGRAYQTCIGWVASLLPISIFELLIVAAIVLFILWIIFFIKKTKKSGIKESGTKIINLLLVITSVSTLYIATAGMAYHRNQFKLPVQNIETVEQDKYYDVSMWCINKMNALSNQLTYDENGSVVNPYSQKEMWDLMDQAFTLVECDSYTKYTAKPKPLYIFGWLYTELNIVGVSFLPTGEANYNYMCPAMDLPTTIAHELAHTKGIMNETDANNCAAYVCLNSGVPYFQYSALALMLDAIDTLAYTSNNLEKYEAFYNSIDPKIKGDFKYVNKFWSEHQLFSKIGNWFNNLYLKIFGSETTKDYIDHGESATIIVDDEPTFVVITLSPYQEIAIDYWLKESGH